MLDFPLEIQVHSLGVFLDSSLSLDVQVLAVARGAFKNRAPTALHPFHEMSDLATITHVLIISGLDYCNTPCKTAFEDC